MHRREFLTAAAALAGLAVVRTEAFAGVAPTPITVYKTPTCGCCKAWVQYLEGEGFAPKVFDQSDDAMDQTKFSMGVPSTLWSCHTAVVGQYVIEGHVPAEDIRRLLKEKPKVLGLSAPGMPQSSPGMYRKGDPRVPYDVVAFARTGAPTVFAKH